MLREEWEALASAFSFFTRIPLRPREFRLERGVFYLPLVGLFLGAISFFLAKKLDPLCGPALSAFFVLAIGYYLADYFHFDGLLDTVDALAAGGDQEKKLKILKTPDVGALGVLFAFFFLLGEFLLSVELLRKGQIEAFFWRPLVGREALGLLALVGKPAKREGLGTLFLSTSRRRLFLIQFLWPLLFFKAAFPTLLSFLLVFFLKTKFEKNFGGLTGDLLGATVLLTQWIFLLGFLIGGSFSPW